MRLAELCRTLETDLIRLTSGFSCRNFSQKESLESDKNH